MAESKNEAAYVLPEDAASSSEYQVFPNFPGRWLPGSPVLVSDLGMSADEAAARIKELGLPLKRVNAKPSQRAEAPRHVGQMVSVATLASGEPEAQAAPPSEEPAAPLPPDEGEKA